MRILALAAVATAALAVSACSTKRADFMMDKAKVDAETHQIWNLPRMTSTAIDLNNSAGYARQTRILWFFVVSGDNTTVEIPLLYDLLGNSTQLDPLPAIAAGRAIEQANADGLLITRVEDTTSGLPPIYEKRSSMVVGKPLMIEDRGIVDANQYLQARYADEILNDSTLQLLSDTGILSVVPGLGNLLGR